MSARALKFPFPPSVLIPFVGVSGGMLFVLAANRTSPLTALLAVVGLIVSFVVLQSPGWGVLLIAAVIPIERIGRFTSDSSMYTVSLMRIVGLLVLGSFLLHALTKKWKFNFGVALLLYVGYCLMGLLTVFYTTDLLGGVRGAGAIVGNLLFFFLIINLVRNWSLAKITVIVWLSASVLIGAYTIYDWHFRGHSSTESQIGETEARMDTVFVDTSEWESLDQIPRATGTTSHAAVYGINLIMTLPFFAFLFRTKMKWQHKALALGGLLVIAYNIVLTNTRAAILLGLMTVGLCALRRMITLSLPKLIAAALVGSVMLFFVPDAIWKRVLDVSNYSYQRSGTLRIRLQYWDAGLRIAADNWLTGIGFGNKNTIPKYINGHGPESTSVHNDYLQTFMEVGVVGWLMFFGFVGLTLWSSFRAASILKRLPDRQEQYWFMVACQITMVAALLYGFQVDVYHFPLKGWWLIASLSWVMYWLAGREQKTSFERSTTEARLA